ncbi:MAG: DNA cytosine methyltransferase [Acidobacteriota bacterium]
MEQREILHFHLFCGLGGGALGFNRGRAELNGLRGRFRCIGGSDVSPAAIRDFESITGARGTVLDMFDREQYRAFHGAEPPNNWREASPDDIRRAAGNERPHIVFLSAPCKGFSGLLSESCSKTDKYQALNRLTLRGVWLMLEAWADDPPELVIFENVPRIATRGRALLDQINALLRSFGYAVAETFHDCGEIGGLAQSRKRFLLVARHVAKVPPFLYEPPKRPLRAVGEILERLPLPGDLRGGPMHSLPNLQWKTWVRLAFVEAGSDWRSLNKLRVVDGRLADYLLVPEQRNDCLGVNPWDGPIGTVTGDARPMKGAFAVADPRPAWNRHSNNLTVENWDEPSKTVIAGGKGVQGGWLSIADPRFPNSQGEHGTKYHVQPWTEPSDTITGSDRVGSGALCIADPRLRMKSGRSDLYGVTRLDETASAVIGHASHDNSKCCVADPRLPEPDEKLVAVIRALDGTWHRPFTTLELAALQSLVDPDNLIDLDGNSDSRKREAIGNAVPPRAAQAIADLMGQTLLMAWSGQSFVLSTLPIWVQPVAVALSVKTPEVQP